MPAPGYRAFAVQREPRWPWAVAYLASRLAEAMETSMAKNNDKQDGHLDGAVRDRSQTKTPSGHWVKRDSDTGRFMDQKRDKEPFKGVRKEK